MADCKLCRKNIDSGQSRTMLTWKDADNETQVVTVHRKCKENLLRTDHAGLVNEVGELRELLASAYIKISGKRIHASDCATSDAPAYTPKECDCDYIEEAPEIPCFEGTREALNNLKGESDDRV